MRVCQSYMTLHPIPSKFPYLWGKFYFLFYQWRKGCPVASKLINESEKFIYCMLLSSLKDCFVFSPTVQRRCDGDDDISLQKISIWFDGCHDDSSMTNVSLIISSWIFKLLPWVERPVDDISHGWWVPDRCVPIPIIDRGTHCSGTHRTGDKSSKGHNRVIQGSGMGYTGEEKSRKKPSGTHRSGTDCHVSRCWSQFSA